MEIIGALFGLFFLLLMGWLVLRAAVGLLLIPVAIIYEIVSSIRGFFIKLRRRAEDKAHWAKLESEIGMQIDWSIFNQEVNQNP